MAMANRFLKPVTSVTGLVPSKSLLKIEILGESPGARFVQYIVLAEEMRNFVDQKHDEIDLFHWFYYHIRWMRLQQATGTVRTARGEFPQKHPEVLGSSKTLPTFMVVRQTLWKRRLGKRTVP